MSEVHAETTRFVRTEIVPEQAPPITEKGAVKWVRENLFSGWLNILLTVVSLFIIYTILSALLPWFTNSVWTTESLAGCREVLAEKGLTGHGGACFLGHHGPLEPVDLRLLPARALLAADPGLHRLPAGHCACPLPGHTAPGAVGIAGRALRGLLADMGRQPLGPDPDGGRFRCRCGGLHCRQPHGRQPRCREYPRQHRGHPAAGSVLDVSGRAAGQRPCLGRAARDHQDRLQRHRRLHAGADHRHIGDHPVAAAGHPACAGPPVAPVHHHQGVGRLHRDHPRRAADRLAVHGVACC